MESREYRVIAVRQGAVRPSGSWLYVWVDAADGAVAYVGATGLDPELRAHLHITSDNPDHGRVRASVPHYQERDFDVLAFRLPDGAKRPDMKAALVEQLAGSSRDASTDADSGAFPDVIGPIIEALESHRSQLQQPSQ
jgi:hypothetical protein